MKKLHILLLLAVTLTLFGCQQQKTAPAPKDETAKITEEAMTEENTQATEDLLSWTSETAETATQPAFLEGDYEGAVNVDTCGLYRLAISVEENQDVLGNGEGQGEVACSLNLNGKIDRFGAIEGQVSGTDVFTAKGQRFTWFFDGTFTGRLDDKDGEISIMMAGIGHECPPNIPCEDLEKKFTALLTRK